MSSTPSDALSERTTAYLPALEHAIRRRGIPKRLEVDNGAAFRSQHLALCCAKLGIALIHATPYSPQGKGKMELIRYGTRAGIGWGATGASLNDD